MVGGFELHVVAQHRRELQGFSWLWWAQAGSSLLGSVSLAAGDSLVVSLGAAGTGGVGPRHRLPYLAFGVAPCLSGAAPSTAGDSHLGNAVAGNGR
ncbi:hypothetical protein Syncc9902_0069 [Synechococcus sp. CC9902]|nr:hypothetical protein Syncc9902_0069 [Synechococcus sp. CC9902]